MYVACGVLHSWSKEYPTYYHDRSSGKLDSEHVTMVRKVVRTTLHKNSWVLGKNHIKLNCSGLGKGVC
ncbi:hypothetical protein BT69DRAFT_1122590 [Atractiella rhizophila]|nr:hypothetical protein BT69DRAFT_1122590 [Atractiella rhizophila]